MSHSVASDSKTSLKKHDPVRTSSFAISRPASSSLQNAEPQKHVVMIKSSGSRVFMRSVESTAVMTTTTISKDTMSIPDHEESKPISSVTSFRAPSDFSPSDPVHGGEKPNDLLLRLFSMWPTQLTASYRPHVQINEEATSEFNIRRLKEMYPTVPGHGNRMQKAKAAGVVVETVCHLGKKVHYLNLSRHDDVMGGVRGVRG